MLMTRKKKSTDNDGLRLSYPKTKRKRARKEWIDDVEDGIETGLAIAEITSELIVTILRLL